MHTRKGIEVRGELTNGGDALIRILTDAERFGLAVLSVDVKSDGQRGRLHMSAAFASPCQPVDTALLAARLERHSGVLAVQCSEITFAGPEEMAA